MTAIAVLNLTGVPGIKQANLAWTCSENPCLSYLQLASTEIWESETDDRSAATKIDTIQGYSYARGGLPDNTTRYYWVRLIDASGQVSDWYPESATAGVAVTTLASVSLALTLTSDSCVVRSDAQGNVSSWATARTTAKVLDGTVDVTAQWALSISPGSGVTAGLSGTTVSVTGMSVATGYVDISAAKSGATTLVKRFSIAKTMDGMPGYTAWLTKDSVVLQADENGVVSDYSSATTSFMVSVFGADDTANWSVQINQKSASVTASLNTSTLSVSSMSSDSGLVELRASKAGTSIYKTFTLAKARRGVTGTGTAGTRGSGRAYVSGRSSWSDSVAASAIVSAYGNGPVVGDEVSQYGTGFASTRRYDGATWLVMGQVIDGNLLVTETVTAARVVSGWVYAGTISASQITAGTISADRIVGGVLTAGSGYLYIQGTIMPQYGGNLAVVASVNSGIANTGRSYGVGGEGLRGICEETNGKGVVGLGATWDFYANGGGSNYGPFTGSHDALILKGTSFEPGDIICDISVVNRRSVSSAITIVDVSDSANRPAVGIAVQSHELTIDTTPAALRSADGAPLPLATQYTATHDVVIVNGVGEGMVNVCGEGGDIAIGDLIVTSSMQGKGMRQTDGIVRNTTVAKSREAVAFSSQTEVKQISCIYLCG